jgi:hypothetical protein
MASSYSQYKIELQATGENSGTWGTITNANFGSATPGVYQGFEQAIGGRADITMSSTTVTLTLTDTNAAQDARALYLNLSGTPGGAADLVVPAIQKAYLVKNGTNAVVTIKVTGQTGVPVPVGKTVWVYNNGTDVVTAVDHIPSLTLGAALPVASGGSGATTLTGVLKGNGTSAFTAGTVDLASEVTGVLPAANGGTGVNNSTRTLTISSNSGTLNFTAASKTLGISNSLTLAGTDATTMTFPSTSATIARTDAAQTFTGTQTFSSALVLPAGTVSAPSFAPTGDTNTGIFFPAADTIAFAEGGAEAMRINSSGNVGIGVTPSAWNSLYRSMQIGSAAALSGRTDSNLVELSSNSFRNSGGGWTYITSSTASRYDQGGGEHYWYTAASGTAGNAVSWSERMRIDSSGNVGIGTSSPGALLAVNGTALLGSAGFRSYEFVGGASTYTKTLTIGGLSDGVTIVYIGLIVSASATSIAAAYLIGGSAAATTNQKTLVTLNATASGSASIAAAAKSSGGFTVAITLSGGNNSTLVVYGMGSGAANMTATFA